MPLIRIPAAFDHPIWVFETLCDETARPSNARENRSADPLSRTTALSPRRACRANLIRDGSTFPPAARPDEPRAEKNQGRWFRDWRAGVRHNLHTGESRIPVRRGIDHCEGSARDRHAVELKVICS
jgi:hypothetical protein